MMNDIVNWYKYCFNQTIDCVSLSTLMQILREYKKKNPLMPNKHNIKITQFNRKPFFYTVQTFPKRKKKSNYRTAGVCLYQNTL